MLDQPWPEPLIVQVVLQVQPLQEPARVVATGGHRITVCMYCTPVFAGGWRQEAVS